MAGEYDRQKWFAHSGIRNADRCKVSFDSATASLNPPPKYAQLIFLSLSASPIVRTEEGGIMFCVAGDGARKPLG